MKSQNQEIQILFSSSKQIQWESFTTQTTKIQIWNLMQLMKVPTRIQQLQDNQTNLKFQMESFRSLKREEEEEQALLRIREKWVKTIASKMSQATLVIKTLQELMMKVISLGISILEISHFQLKMKTFLSKQTDPYRTAVRVAKEAKLMLQTMDQTIKLNQIGKTLS